MYGNNRIKRYVLPTAMYIIVLVGAGMHMTAMPAMATERPIAQEKNPPGDIPDTQVFVTYRSPSGFSLKVPEGWARTDRPDGASFSDKYNAITVTLAAASIAPTVVSARLHDAVDLVRGGRAVKIEAVKDVALRAGPAVMIAYTSNSEPNPVTDKQLRLENHRYLIYRGGKLATLELSSPLGADNADQWKFISNSVQWR